jgi:hypothetical protein
MLKPRLRRLLSQPCVEYEEALAEKPALGEGTMRRLWIASAAIALAGLIGSPSTDAQQSSSSSSGAPLASAEYSQDPTLRCELLEAKRVSGGALLVRWRIVNGAGAGGGGLVATTAKPILYSFHWEELFYIDPAENKRYQFLTDSAGHKILEVFEGELAGGQQRANWAKFPAPPATSSKISIQIPRFPPFEDIPVSQ